MLRPTSAFLALLISGISCRSSWASVRAENRRPVRPSEYRRDARAEVATDTSAGQPRARPAAAAACPRSGAPGGPVRGRTLDRRSSRHSAVRTRLPLWSWRDASDTRCAYGPWRHARRTPHGHGRCARQAGRHLGHGRARGLRRRHLRSSGHAFVLLPQFLERLGQVGLARGRRVGAVRELIQLLRRDVLALSDARFGPERAWPLDGLSYPVLASHAYLPFLTGTPRFLSRALSRAEPALMPARLSAALSLASVHLGLPRAVAIAIFAAVPRVALLRGGALVEHGRVVFVREHVALELVAQARVVGLRLGPRAGERVRAVLAAIADLRRRDFACTYHANSTFLATRVSYCHLHAKAPASLQTTGRATPQELEPCDARSTYQTHVEIAPARAADLSYLREILEASRLGPCSDRRRQHRRDRILTHGAGLRATSDNPTERGSRRLGNRCTWQLTTRTRRLTATRQRRGGRPVRHRLTSLHRGE